MGRAIAKGVSSSQHHVRLNTRSLFPPTRLQYSAPSFLFTRATLAGRPVFLSIWPLARGAHPIAVMPNVPHLRSPYQKVGRIVYFGRMLDKIRLHRDGKLPADYQANYGDASPNVFDARCCRFLGMPHAEIVRQVASGATYEAVLAWC